MPDRSRIPGVLRRAAIVLLVGAVAGAGWSGFRAWGAWRAVERIPFDAGAARGDLEAQRSTGTTLPGNESTPTMPAPNPFDDVLGVLVIGTDQRSVVDLSGRADVILLFVVPPGNASPLLFSIPRDLWLPNPCTGAMSRVNVNLHGCGDVVSGPEQLAVAVEDFTGIGVDHFVVLGFDGFRAVIDRVGGSEICVEHQVRDWRSGLDLPAGCTVAGGDQALAWVRSRHTEELVGGRWRAMPGVNDLARNERQQDLVIQALLRLKGFRNVAELSALVDDLAGAFVIDDGLSLTDAVSLAWNLRGVDVDQIVRLVIPTRGFLSPAGEAVLRPTEPFEDTLRSAHPDADLILEPGTPIASGVRSSPPAQ